MLAETPRQRFCVPIERRRKLRGLNEDSKPVEDAIQVPQLRNQLPTRGYKGVDDVDNRLVFDLPQHCHDVVGVEWGSKRACNGESQRFEFPVGDALRTMAPPSHRLIKI